MKVLLVTPDYPPVLNSAARLSQDLAEDLARMGHAVSVITRKPERYLAPDSPRPEPERVGVRVRRLPNLPGPRHIPLLRIIEQAWTGLAAFFASLWAGRQDSIIVYSPPLPLALAALGVAKLTGARLITNVQDLYPRTAVDLGLLRGARAIRFAEWLEQVLYRGSDIVTVHSDGNGAHVSARGGRAVRVVHNWVDLDALKPGPVENAWRSRHGLDGRFLVTFAGTMGFAQGLEDVLEAAALLKGTADLLFVLAGNGVLRPKLEREVAARGLDHVRFLPPQGPEDYLALLHASDLCLVTLDKKLATPVVPGKLQSVLAAGRPVVFYANPASDGREMVEEARAGRFVPAGDIAGLAAAIHAAWADRAAGLSMGENGRRYAVDHFDRKQGIGQYAQLLEMKS